jgi:hypothetical protein
VGGGLAAVVYGYLFPAQEGVPKPDEQEAVVADRHVGRPSATP